MKWIISGGLALTSFLSGGTALADHDYERERCGRYGCNQYEHDYSNNDRNRNRDRDRGAFSPGPFDRSPVEFAPCMPGATCYYDREPDQRSSR